MVELRLASPDDSSQILDIYGPIIENTSISFKYQVPSGSAFRDRIQNILKTHPWLVCVYQGQVVGYAYAGPHRSREAYRWSTETSVYIAEGFQQKGIASSLYRALLEGLQIQGYYTALAGITLPNRASVSFHQSYGFTPVGTYHQVGFKFGQWHSVGWWEYQLKSDDTEPVPPLSMDTLVKLEKWQELINSQIKNINLQTLS